MNRRSGRLGAMSATLVLSVPLGGLSGQGISGLNVSVSPCEWTLSSTNSPVPISASGTHTEYMPVGNATMVMLLPGPKQGGTTSGTITVSNLSGPGTYAVGEASGPDASGSVFSVSDAARSFGISTSGPSGPTSPAMLTVLSAGPQGLVGTVTGEYFVNASSGTPSMGTVLTVQIEFWARSVGGCS